MLRFEHPPGQGSGGPAKFRRSGECYGAGWWLAGNRWASGHRSDQNRCFESRRGLLQKGDRELIGHIRQAPVL